MGATSIFIMEGVDVVNRCWAKKHLLFNMPNERQIQWTHVCNITITGLPTILTGHMVPHLSMASLLDIWPLCKAGCKALFDDDYCKMIFNGSVILRGYKDPSTDLGALPINGCNMMQTSQPQSAPDVDCAQHDMCPAIHPSVTLASFTHSMCTHVNGVKFAHQTLCNPKISTMLKAVRKGFLKGCPSLSKKLILKYLFPVWRWLKDT